MMKRSPLMCVLVLSSAVSAQAQDLPSLREFRERARSADVPAVEGAAQAAPQAQTPAECAAVDLKGPLTIEGRMFTWSILYDIASGGQAAAVIESRSNGYDLKTAAGGIVASATEEGGIVQVSACGALIGSIKEVETGWNGERAFQVYDASGKLAAQTPQIDYLQKSIALLDGAGNGLAGMRSTHWFYDRWEMTTLSPTLDSRLALMVLTYNHAADRKESRKRQMERHSDRPDRGGRDR